MTSDENITGYVGEADLFEYLKNNAVHSLRVHETDGGKFQIFARVNWKGGELQLITTRRKPREWASLDRLAKHFKKAGVVNKLNWVIIFSG